MKTLLTLLLSFVCGVGAIIEIREGNRIDAILWLVVAIFCLEAGRL